MPWTNTSKTVSVTCPNQTSLFRSTVVRRGSGRQTSAAIMFQTCSLVLCSTKEMPSSLFRDSCVKRPACCVSRSRSRRVGYRLRGGCKACT
ncbi:hypothetical protein DPMN_117363 [Dreissena polymorpha]|uniref:Uncharacterized protein n=1 Tax=Dreissena polymorpha TaxID=45954 RepID=A0A9D4KPU7_DREPO|nr:hypothetical protein DPMN_117363 [Dreissena polymorpha]